MMNKQLYDLCNKKQYIYLFNSEKISFFFVDKITWTIKVDLNFFRSGFGYSSRNVFM